MRVAALYGKHDIRVEDWATPHPGPGQLLVKVALCGICGTELKYWHGHNIDWQGNPIKYPRVFGHEYSGTVAEVGAGVKNFKAGDRVTVAPYISCGKCFYCHTGVENFCTDKTVNANLNNGAWAEYMLVTDGTVYAIPDNMSFEVASLSEPLSCCLHSMDRAKIQPGSSVAIVGAGPIGLMLIALAKRGGASLVIVSEPAPARRQVAFEMGADLVVNPLEQDLVEAVRAVTRGWGVDYSFEAVGKSAAARQAIDIARNAGTIVIMGVALPDDQMIVTPFELHIRELTLLGAVSRSYAYDRTVRMLSALDLKPLFTHTFPLEEIATAITYCVDGRGAKILVQP